MTSDSAPLILVTGASGAAGQFVVPALVDAGFRVRAQFSRKPGAEPRAMWLQHDFLASLDVAGLVEGCAGVVHLAAALSDVTVMDRVNVEATRVLAQAASKAGVRYFGHASSIVVYGSPRRTEIDETHPTLDPQKPMRAQYCAEPYMLEYARTKTLAERALQKIQTAMAIDAYRPAVVADRARLLECGDWGRGRKIASWYRASQYVCAEDVAAAIVHLLGRGLVQTTGASWTAYNLCEAPSPTYSQIAARAFAKTGDPRFKVPLEIPWAADVMLHVLRYGPPFDRRHLGHMKISDVKLARTGFTRTLGLDRAINQAIAQLQSKTPHATGA